VGGWCAVGVVFVVVLGNGFFYGGECKIAWLFCFV